TIRSSDSTVASVYDSTRSYRIGKVVLPDDHRPGVCATLLVEPDGDDHPMLKPPDQDPDTATIRLLGPLLVLGGRWGPLRGIATGRATRLLQRVALAGGSTVDTDELIDALWPDRAPPSASRTTAALISRIRSALGPFIIVGHASGGYRLGVEEGW